ncbi:cytochrome P450 2F2-like isoform X2 [Rhinatrema bivittatum]|uniref:cytochrome P450 2F2-like isoform X2 n=1 Tax=Rhinatrema bivittatum TaxID=194408 RepID=UPI00112B697E|nr:cytochrome P450 2F2-like isoform X2 [Rhinatrema bivittatum]
MKCWPVSFVSLLLVFFNSRGSRGARALPAMDFGIVVGTLLAFCLTYVILKSGKMWRRARSLPPGPTPLPFIGNLHQVNPRDVTKSLMKLHKKYGSVYTVHLGQEPHVMLCGYQAVKEALIDNSEIFSGRGFYPVFYNFTKGDDIAFSNGEKWKALRGFAIQILREFGMGKKSIEERIQEEAQYLIEEFRKTNMSPFNLINPMGRAVSNVICSIVFGNRFDYKDKNFTLLVSCIQNNFRIMSNIWGVLYNFYSDLMDYLPGPHKEIFTNFEKLRDFIEEKVKKNQESLDPNNPRDYVDCFLIKMEKEKNNIKNLFNMNTLVMSTLLLFFAGTESVGLTLRYGFLILMKYPAIAAKVQEEIDHVIGCHQMPSYEDRIRMPYTTAVLHEIQRYADVIPLSVPHELTADINFRGYNLRKGTQVTPLLTSVHRDPTQYQDPDKFDPTNFLDANGRFKKREALMPFSAGKRICFGESLAMTELFIYFTTILQNFSFKSLIPSEEIDLTPLGVGLGNIHMPYEICMIPR